MRRLLLIILYLILSVGVIQAQHLKKDGTPDMRYKENKKAYSTSTHKTTTHSKSTYNSSVKRDSKGRIVRSSAARHAFMKKTGYPHGRPGYVIDHMKPLKEGGCDCPENMQWQTIEQAKAKDKWE